MVFLDFWWSFVLLIHDLILRMHPWKEEASSFAGKTALKINRSVKTPWHNPSKGVARSVLWAPDWIGVVSNSLEDCFGDQFWPVFQCVVCFPTYDYRLQGLACLQTHDLRLQEVVCFQTHDHRFYGIDYFYTHDRRLRGVTCFHTHEQCLQGVSCFQTRHNTYQALGRKLELANSCASVQCSVWSVASGHRKGQGSIPDKALQLLFHPLRLFILLRRSCSLSYLLASH